MPITDMTNLEFSLPFFAVASCHLANTTSNSCNYLANRWKRYTLWGGLVGDIQLTSVCDVLLYLSCYQQAESILMQLIALLPDQIKRLELHKIYVADKEARKVAVNIPRTISRSHPPQADSPYLANPTSMQTHTQAKALSAIAQAATAPSQTSQHASQV